MTATLRFSLPDERAEFHDAVHGSAWRGVIWEFDQWMRSELKYKETPAKLQEARDKLSEMLQGAGLDIYEE